ncbi:putative ribonuclease H-like domain-containing protein [Tanacetum coccineum]
MINDTWKIKIEQFFQIQDYALWEVIEYGNSYKPTTKVTTNADGSSTSTVVTTPVTTDEKIQKKNDVKARSMLPMTLPNEHILTFSQYKDAKTLFEAIQARFGGNEATKKTQKILLKQMSLPTEWNTHVVVWGKKPDIGMMNIDELYNNFKIVEQEVKRSGASSSDSSIQNVAFVSTPSNSNDVKPASVQVNTGSTSIGTASTNAANISDATVYAFLAHQPNGSQVVYDDLQQIHDDDLEEIDLKWNMAMISIRARKFYHRTGRKLVVDGGNTAGFDKSKIKCFNCHKNKSHESSKKSVIVEETSPTAMIAFDGGDKSNFDLANYKRGLASVEEQLVFYKKNEVAFCDQIAVLKRDATFRDSKIDTLKTLVEKLKKEKEGIKIKVDGFENASKNLDTLVSSQISINNNKGIGFDKYNAIASPPTGMFAPPTVDLSNSLRLNNIVPSKGLTCLIAKATTDESNMWHRRLGHINFKTMNKLVKGNLVRGLPSKTFENDHTCVACQKGKQHKASCKTKLVSSVSKPLLILHMDLFRPTFVKSLMGKMYCLVITDDYSRFSWVFFLAKKDETSIVLKTFITGIENQLNHKVKAISNARTPQQNGVAERKNRTLIEAAKTMLADLLLLIPGDPHVALKDTRIFDSGCSRHMTGNKSYLRIMMKDLLLLLEVLRESMNYHPVNTGNRFNGNAGLERTSSRKRDEEDDSSSKSDAELNNAAKNQALASKANNSGEDTHVNGTNPAKDDYWLAQENEDYNSYRNTLHPGGNSYDDDISLTRSRNGKSEDIKYNCRKQRLQWAHTAVQTKEDEINIMKLFLSQIEPKKVNQALDEESWVEAMQEELLQFKLLDVWTVVDLPYGKKAIGSKWVLTHTHKKDQEVSGFVDPAHPNKVYKVKKALYGLHQAPRAWYETLSTYLLENGYRRGSIDKTLFIKKIKDDILLIQVYVDDIIFGSTKESLSTEFEQLMHKKFQMSSMRKLTFVFGLQDDKVKIPDQDYILLPLLHINSHVFSSDEENDSSSKSDAGLNNAAKNQASEANNLGKDNSGCSSNSSLPNENQEGQNEQRNNYWLAQENEDYNSYRITTPVNVAGPPNADHRQEEGIDYDEVFAPVARIEAIRLFLAYASYMNFTVYQMDVKSAFLYGTIEEEVEQRKDGIFLSQDKYVKEILQKFGYSSVKSASTPMETHKPLTKDKHGTDVDVHLYKSMIGSLMYLTSSRPDIVFAVCLLYPKASPLELVAFSDSDYACASLDRKSTTGGCQFLGCRLVSWQCKKQAIVANSITEAEYIAASNCCAQVLWLQNQLFDFGYNFMKTKIHIYNENAICVVKNPVSHSKTKHIEIRYHFIRDCYEKGLIEMVKIHKDNNVADLLTKAFDVTRSSMDLKMNESYADNVWVVSIHLWSHKQLTLTATVRTFANGTQQIEASIDSKSYTITVDSVRTKLQLADTTGINNLPDADIYAVLATLSPKSGRWDQFGSPLATALICLSRNRIYNFSKLIFDGMVLNIASSSKFLMYPRGYTGDFVPLPPAMMAGVEQVQDKATFTSVEVETERATTTTSGLDARLDSGNIHETLLRIGSLETELRETKQTFGNALLTLVKKVKTLEVALKRKSKKVMLSESDDEETEAQGWKIQDIDDDPLISLVEDFTTPTKTKDNPQDEVHDKEISPTTLEEAKILSKVTSQDKSVDKGRRYKRRKGPKGKEVSTDGIDFSTDFEDVSSGFNEDQGFNTGIKGVSTSSLAVSTRSGPISTDSTKVTIPSLVRSRREGKAPMTEEEETQAPKKTREQILQEEASLAEAIRLDSLEKEEMAKQIHLDSLLAKRMAEQELSKQQELTEQQKKRKAQVQFKAQHYTQED